MQHDEAAKPKGPAADEEPAPAEAGPCVAQGDLCHFSGYDELAARLGIEKTHAVVRGEKTRWTWQGVIVTGIVGTILAFAWGVVGSLYRIPNLEAIAGAITVLFLPLFVYLRWHAPRDYLILHDDRIRFLRNVKFVSGVGVGELGDSIPLAGVNRVVYRTSFWKKWLTLVLEGGERISFKHGVINRRRRMPGIETVRMRTAADLLGYLGVPHRFNYGLAVATPVFVTLWAVVSNLDYRSLAQAQEQERGRAQEAAAAAQNSDRYEAIRTSDVHTGPFMGVPVGRIPAGGRFDGVASTNAGGQSWVRIESGPLAGRFVWAANLRRIGAESAEPTSGNTAMTVTEPAPIPAPPAPEGPSQRWLTGAWRPAGELVDCSPPPIVFGSNGTVRWFEDGGEWELDRGRLAIVWSQGPSFNTMNPYPVYYPIDRIDENRFSIRDERDISLVYDRCV